jgi:2-C-methyl-D-erythritol 2,4-cyclodiphosphate synthase
MTGDFRIGFGYDIHRLEAGLKLVLGGVVVSENIGCVAHSDGDVLLHAICDAMLGAAAAGDIGSHFPDTDPAFGGISSMELLIRARRIIEARTFCVVNVDCTVVLQEPKIMPFSETMRSNISSALGIEQDAVSIKATTAERLGPIGEKKGIEAHAVVLLARLAEND